MTREALKKLNEKQMNYCKTLSALIDRAKIKGLKENCCGSVCIRSWVLNLTEQHTSHTDGGRKSAYIARKRRKSK